MPEGLVNQIKNRLFEITKNSKKAVLTEHNQLIQELHTYQGALEKQNNDLQQQILRLRQSRAGYHDRYELAPAAFFVLNNQGRVLDVNLVGAALIGTKKTHLITNDFTRYVAPEFIDAFLYHCKWTLESNAKQTCELKLKKEDGSTFFARIESIVVSVNGRDEKQMQTIITDISDRKQIEGALEAARSRADGTGKIKSEFLSKMSHEFRTPLNHIIGFTQLAREHDTQRLDDTQTKYLDAVLQSSQQLLSMVEDILDLSKLEAGTLQPELAEVNLEALLNEGLSEFRQKAIDHGMTLLEDLDGIPDAIRADARMLKQIITHLLANAIKFTPDGGEVLLKARIVDCIVRSGRRCGDAKDFKIFEECIEARNMNGAVLNQCIEISVADTGIGLKPEDQKWIFEPFKQVDESLNRNHQGPGIGLPLAKNLVELHGGKIWAESAGTGKGSAFRFILPI